MFFLNDVIRRHMTAFYDGFLWRQITSYDVRLQMKEHRCIYAQNMHKTREYIYI